MFQIIDVEILELQVSSLEVLSAELKGGRAKCPYDPDANYTIIYVGKTQTFSLRRCLFRGGCICFPLKLNKQFNEKRKN